MSDKPVEAANFFHLSKLHTYCIGYMHISEYYFAVQHARLCASANFFQERKLNTGQKVKFRPSPSPVRYLPVKVAQIFSYSFAMSANKFQKAAFSSMCLKANMGAIEIIHCIKKLQVKKFRSK
jgi:hypothetical protein